MLLEFVAKYEGAFQQADSLRQDALNRRNDAVLEAVENGVSQDAVAQRLGITPARVSQIVKRARHQRGADQHGALA